MYFSRTFKALNFDFQIQGLSRTFKVRANPVLMSCHGLKIQMTTCWILSVLLAWTSVWVLTQSIGSQVSRRSSYAGFVADSLIQVAKLLMPLLSPGQEISIGCFLRHTWCLVSCVTCRKVVKMEPCLSQNGTLHPGGPCLLLSLVRGKDL